MLVYKRSYLLVIVFIPFLLFGCTHYAKTDWNRETITRSDTENLYEVQIAAKTYAAPGLPDVLMIGMVHVAYPEFYYKVKDKLDEADIVIAECPMIYTPYLTPEERRIEFIKSIESVASGFASLGLSLPADSTKLSTIFEDENIKEHFNSYILHSVKSLYKDPWGNDAWYYPDRVFNSASDTTSTGMLCSYGPNGVWDGEDVNSDDIVIPIKEDPWLKEVQSKFKGYTSKQEIIVEELDNAVLQVKYLLPEDNWIPGDWKTSNYKEYFKTIDNYSEYRKKLYAKKENFKVWWLSPYHYWVYISNHWKNYMNNINKGTPSKIVKHAVARNDRAWELIHFHITENPKNAKTIGIPWGKAHMPDFEARLLNLLGYNKVDEEWITIWSETNTAGTIPDRFAHNLLRRLTKQQILDLFSD
jgi:hypothetical protein